MGQEWSWPGVLGLVPARHCSDPFAGSVTADLPACTGDSSLHPGVQRMTQRSRVLQMLRTAGEKGVRSDEFYKAYMPRAGARIHELRSEGHEITSEQERQFVRYRLVGMGGGAPVASPASLDCCGEFSGVASSHSGERCTGDQDQAEGPSSAPVSGRPVEVVSGVPARSVPSFFDYDADWAA